MRLSDLNARLDWEGAPESVDVAYLYFDCPHCRGSEYICVKIATNPDPAATRVWKWNGERNLERLTLEPSLNFHGHWHGFVRDGEVTDA